MRQSAGESRDKETHFSLRKKVETEGRGEPGYYLTWPSPAVPPPSASAPPASSGARPRAASWPPAPPGAWPPHPAWWITTESPHQPNYAQLKLNCR